MGSTLEDADEIIASTPITDSEVNAPIDAMN